MPDATAQTYKKLFAGLSILHTGTDDAPDFIKNDAGLIEKYLHLAGGVIVTIRPQEQQTNDQKQYSLPSILGRTRRVASQ